jgi:hypothetical protein
VAFGRWVLSTLASGWSGDGVEAAEKKLSVIEDVDRDDMKRARLENLTGVRERERLAARRNARMTGGVVFCKGLCGFRIVADADMVGSGLWCSAPSSVFECDGVSV